MQRNLPFVLAMLSCAVSSADEVYLKGGGRVCGRVVQRTATSVEVDIGAGTVAVAAKQVERIVEGRSALDVYRERAGALDPKDREGWAALGRWASDQGLATQSREAFHRVEAIDPTDAEANQALGNVQVNGRWMTEEEGYRALGFVSFEGEWMTPAEQQAIETSARGRQRSGPGAGRGARAPGGVASERSRGASEGGREGGPGEPTGPGGHAAVVGMGAGRWPPPPTPPTPPRPPRPPTPPRPPAPRTGVNP